MRKLLILIVVLGMASAANATYTLMVDQTGVQGVAPVDGSGYYDPVDTDLELLPTEYIWIGVHNDTQGVEGALQKGQFFLGIVTPDPAAWTGSWIQYKPPLTPNAPDNIYMGPTQVGQPTLIDMWNLNLTDATVTPQGVGVLDAKELHCEELGDVTVHLFDNTMAIIDTITIHQIIPEPMTMVLLGLGGLFLRRRK